MPPGVRKMTMAELQDLPVIFDLPTAGRAFGLGKSKCYELGRQGEFPCTVLRLGYKYRVTRHHLFGALGVPEAPAAAVSEEATVPQPQRGASEAETIPATADMAYLVVPVPADRVLDLVREPARELRPTAER